MKRKVAVLDVLFPNVRANMLRLLFCTPPNEHYVRELMNLTGLALCTVQDELRKLNTVGLVTSWSNGYRRYYKANQAHPLFADLRRIVRTCERLPSTKHAVLQRKHSPQRQHKRWQQRATPLPADRVPNWELFSRRKRRRHLTA
jgi:predicted transcriptional regulator